jgi:hypothetical protein
MHFIILENIGIRNAINLNSSSGRTTLSDGSPIAGRMPAFFIQTAQSHLHLITFLNLFEAYLQLFSI